ncbi:MAG: hypothetical protein ACRDOB_29850 [Streptosporangiaceae bacterium]
MDRAAADHIEKEVLGRFPDGAVQSVRVLQYGEDPAIEPGEVGIRLTIEAKAGPEPDGEPLEAFMGAHRAVLKELRRDIRRLSPETKRVEFVTGTEAKNKFMMRLGEDEPSGELTPVMARLGPADLETLDTLIGAGFAANRAQAVRWALARIRERPAYAQLRDRAREIEELKSQF